MSGAPNSRRYQRGRAVRSWLFTCGGLFKNHISHCANVFEPFSKSLLKPPKAGSASGVEEVAGSAAVIIRRAEPDNRDAKIGGPFQQACPVVLKLSTRHAEQIGRASCRERE